MTPGPTALPPSVVEAGVRPIMYSRSAEFIAIWEDVVERLGRVFQTSGDVLVYGASGTGAMSSAVANLTRAGEKVLVASCGNFGNRWASIARDEGAEPVHLEGEWGRPIDPDGVAAALAEHPEIEVVFVTQSETSTGVVSDLPALREAAGDRILVADAVSGLGVVDLPMDEWGIDVVVSGSQKGLMTPPGLAFVAANERSIARSADLGPGGFYLDWERTRKGGSRSPFTPPVTIVCQLQAALRLIEDEGLQDVFARHRVLGRATRAGVQGIGLDLLGPENPEANVVTAFRIPEGVDGKAVPKLMKSRWGVEIAGGQGKLAGQIARIGHCGYYDHRDVLTAVGALEHVMRELGRPVEPGAGVSAVQRVVAETQSKSA
jgi:serine---pyruvate transaminase